MTPATVPQPSVCTRCKAPFEPGGQRCASCGAMLPGNTLSIRHGARAGRMLAAAATDALAEIEALLEEGGLGSERRFTLAREGAASALARLRLFTRRLDEIGWLDGHGRPRRDLIAQLDRAETTLLGYLRELGCTPASAAKLGVDVGRVRSLSLAAQIALARREREGKS